VFGLGRAQVGIGVGQRLAHAGGVLDVLAEDDSLGAAVGGLEVFGDLAGNHGVTLLHDQRAIHVGAGVDAVLDQVAELVAHALVRAPAEGVAVQVHAHHLVGCQVAVLDALPEAVGVERRTEIVAVGDSFGLLG